MVQNVLRLSVNVDTFDEVLERVDNRLDELEAQLAAIVSSPSVGATAAPYILYKDDSWRADELAHIGAAFWCFDPVQRDSSVGAIELGWYVAPMNATEIYLGLVGGGATGGEFLRVKFIDDSGQVLSDFALGEILQRNGNPENRADLIWRYSVNLQQAGITAGSTFKIRLEDNDNRNVAFGTFGVVPEAIVFSA